MRSVVAKTTPKKQNTTEDKTVDADAEEVISDTQRPANLNRFKNLQQGLVSQFVSISFLSIILKRNQEREK
jgi:hypothetical protein